MQTTKFKLNIEEQSDNYGKIIIEPLEKGYGNTLGNALRRVLLSSLKGASITQIKIEGLTHKFSTLQGMSEDTIELILNIKKVKVAYDGDEPVVAKLQAKGPGKVTAKDIQAPPTVKIINPDAIIANLAKNTKLNMEIEIASGYGYSPAKERKTDILGAIPVDAMYSPVERVAYQVDNTRVGRKTDFDKLILEVYTDGSQKPADVVKEAAKILFNFFKQIYEPTTEDEQELETAKGLEAKNPATYELSVEELGLPTRIANALRSGGYPTVKDLANATEKDLREVKNLGTKSIELIRKALKDKEVDFTTK